MTDNTSPFGTYKLNALDQWFLRQAQTMPVSWLGRRLALILRKGVLCRGPKIIDAVVDGLQLRLYMQDNVSERKFLFMPQFFDGFERQLLKEKLKAGDTFVDVGANAGIYTLTAAALVGSIGRVLSIEPNPAVLERLKFNMALNGFNPMIEQAGVSDSEGSFDLTLDDTNLGGSSLVAERSDKKISARKINVRCAPLLSILQKHGIETIHALKIDIEGAEDKALIPFFKNAPKTLHPALIILENSPQDWRQDLPRTLQQAGYRLLQTTRMNMVWGR